MRLIDADALIEQINGRHTFTKSAQEELEKIIYNKACADLITLIKNAPTVESKRRGRWSTRKGSLEMTCSCCKKNTIYDGRSSYDFCPNCGAYMYD